MSIRGPSISCVDEPERAAGIAGQQHALGDGLVRAEDLGRNRHGTRHSSYDRPAMAKKDKKDSKKKDKTADAVEAVRSAVAATAGSAQSLRGPALDLASELADAAGKFRDRLESRVLDEVKGVRSDIKALSARVDALEKKAAPARRTTPRRSPAKSRTAAAKPATASRSAAAKPTATKRAAAKPAARRKPATTRRAAGGTTSAGRSSSRGAGGTTSGS